MPRAARAALLAAPLVLAAWTVVEAAVPHFYVNLDEDPEERWREVILHWKDRGVIGAMLGGGSSNSKVNPPDDALQAFVDNVKIDEDYEGEIRGWVKYAGFNLTRAGMIAFASMYEMNYPTFCSALLAAMPDGTVVHGRNMDYSLELEINGQKVGWPEVTVDVTFLRGGQPLITSVTWPFQLGLHTAMRFNGWTFEQNTRRTGDDLKRNTEQVQQGSQVFGFLVRRVMETTPDFETAVQRLRSLNLAGTMFFIMTGSGPYQAAVIAMDRGGVHETASPPVMRLSKEKNIWHLVQTNDDLNKPAKDLRRPGEERRLLGALQSQVSPEWVFQEMHAPSLFNGGTVFTWIAVPAIGFHRTVPRGKTWEESECSAPESSTRHGVAARRAMQASVSFSVHMGT